jgi:sigma-E factor negative regulatory protein RseB
MSERLTRTLVAQTCGVLIAAWAGLAQAQSSPEALAWLRKIYQATHDLSYTGTFVYQQGNHSETSRITRLADAKGDTEKLEVLDGVPREIVRTNDAVRCYLPESRTVKVDRRSNRRGFPTLLQGEIGALADNYTVTKGDSGRVAGYACDAIVLTPRDSLRYGYRLCADATTGMLLKAVTIDDRGETVEQFTFTKLSIGSVSRDKVRPPATRKWHVEDAEVAPVNLEQAGWITDADLPGFRKVVEVTRTLHKSRPVEQVVYSDGLAAISVFIEPLAPGDKPVQTGLASVGAINIYTREVANHLVTVVGEAPAASVQRIAETVKYRQPH